ncbi:ATP-binding protein [Nocardioides bizhenqiangii]|uniref:AAA family ATPase n=1 Tax=Nocardioides bizhenqiangii TaxID=3095076 RepID=A0ABZ0ZNZ1_9ACTN|nr:AAA family ATPase [Nocardioides sp. HM61]WQQ26038.1 AAA family ATPase [Nocardioides sp. HM61]
MRVAGALIGRARELATLTEALAAAGRAKGRVVLVRGEAGIGKTRLVEELGERAPSHVVLTGRAVPGGGAYRPVAEALVGLLRSGTAVAPEALGPYRVPLGRLLPDWSEPGDRLGGQDADPALVLGEAVARFLAEVGRERPCLVVLEDLQWADADTVAVIVHLAAAVRGLPVLVVVTARDDEPGAYITSMLAKAPDVLHLVLGRLPDEAVAELAAELGVSIDPATLGRVTDQVDGLPLLIEELLADPNAVAGPVPPTFAALVGSRLGGLPESQRRVVTAAAVLGLAPDWSLLGRVIGVAEDDVLAALRAADEAHLLDARDAALRWRHALTRDAVLASLLPPERAVVARRAAQALRDRGRPDDDVAAAGILADAGAGLEAAELLLDVARKDISRGALHTAADLLDRAEAAGAAPAAVAAERVVQLCATGRAAEALGVGTLVLDRATGERHAELALRLARAAVLAGRWDDTTAYVERAGRPDDPRSPALLADAAHGAGQVEDAAAYAAAAVALADRSGTPADRCQALVVQARVARLHNVAASAEGFRTAAQLAAEHGLAALRVDALLGLGSLEALESETTTTLEVARAVAADVGLLGQVTGLDMMLGEHRLLVDGPQAVRELAEDLVERGSALRLPAAEVAGRYVLALAPAVAGRRDDLEHHLNGWATATAGPEAPFLSASARAFAALAVHDLGEACAILDQAITPLARHRSAAPLHQFGLWALLRTVVDDRGAEARETLRRLPAGVRRANRAALAYAGGVAAGRAGQVQAAAALVADAEEALTPLPWLRRTLRLVALESAVTEGWGDPVPLLRAGLAEHEAHAEEPAARTARDLLRRAGAPTRRGRGASAVPPRLAALGVTRRELDVLSLVAEGATNARIAERLFLSKRTVETHVSNLLLKTGTDRRDELARFSE